MKRAAFALVAVVTGVQLAIVVGAITTCMVMKPNAETCDPGGELGQLMSSVITQAFALYAAEK
jgi:hypothetical protein